MSSTGITVTDEALDQIPHPHKEIFKSLLADMNKTIHENLKQNQTKSTQPQQSSQAWSDEQIHTVVYIGLAFLVICITATLAAMYMRSMSEKRRSAAAIKSLLDMMAENRNPR